MNQKVEQNKRKIGKKTEREEERSSEESPFKKATIDDMMEHEESCDEPTPIQNGKERQSTRHIDRDNTPERNQAGGKAPRKQLATKAVPQPHPSPQSQKPKAEKLTRYEEQDLDEDEDEDPEQPHPQRHLATKAPRILEEEDEDDQSNIHTTGLKIRKVLHSRHDSLDLADLDTIPPPPTAYDVITWEDVEQLAKEDTQFLKDWIEINKSLLKRHDVKSLKEARILHENYEELKMIYNRGIRLVQRIQTGRIEITNKVESLKKKVLDAANNL